MKELPPTLDETYDRILQSIPEGDKAIAHTALEWLVYSKRPMTLNEIADAIVVDKEQQVFDIENRLLDPCSILEICSSLVILSEVQDKSSTIDTAKRELRLAHYSVKEYLISARIGGGSASKFRMVDTSAHFSIAQACTAYLLQFNQAEPLPDDTLERYPLARYAAEHWPFADQAFQL